MVDNFRDKAIQGHGLIQQNHTGITGVIFKEKANQNTEKETSKLCRTTRKTLIQKHQALKHSVSKFPSHLTEIKALLTEQCNSFQADRVAKSLENWKSVTSDKDILTTVLGTKNRI